MNFWYKRVIKAKKEGDSDKIVWDFFNTNCAVRGVSLENGLIVLLSDGHEISEYITRPEYNKEGKMTKDGQKARVYKISEIELDQEDAARFLRVTWIGEWIPVLDKKEEELVLD